MAKAPRLLSRLCAGLARGVWRAGCIWLALSGAAWAASGCVAGDGDYIREVCFKDVPGAPRYGHDVLGNTPEWDALIVRFGPSAPDQGAASIQVPNHVFEDLTPRVVDLDQDTIPEVVVVQSSFSAGAQLAVYGFEKNEFSVLTATPHIGTRNRWLAPVGAADLDGDGFLELAYIDRPHLARTLRVWRYRDGALEYVSDLTGLTNHRIGEAFIASGIRDCGAGPEMITADAAWRRVMRIRLSAGSLTANALGAYSPAAIEAALDCR